MDSQILNGAMQRIILVILITYGMFLVDCGQSSSRKPNFVFIFADDFGYGDLSVYGHPTQERGFIDQLAREGMRFTHWYTAAAMCTPSRAALLTGRLPLRSGMIGGTVLLPNHHGGLPHSEITLAEALKDQGYTTGIVGKWHLGINAHSSDDGGYLPHTHGFDYVGTILPYTLAKSCDENEATPPFVNWCFLYRNSTLIQQPIYLQNLTSTFIQDAKSFIYENEDNPFFLYLPLAQTHMPMFNDPRFSGRSKRGAYGDQVNEMSWAVSEVVGTLKELSLEKNTLVFFVSDHGPHLEMCSHGGSAGIFRGGKMTHYEGGVRVPAIAWWPGTILPDQVSNTVVSTMDIFTTFIELAGGQVPKDRVIDGKSIKHVLFQDSKQKPKNVHDILFFHDHMQDILMAVRYKEYKIHFHTFPEVSHLNYSTYCLDGKPLRHYHAAYPPRPKKHIPPLVFDVESDLAEKFPLRVETHRHVLEDVKKLVADHLAISRSDQFILSLNNRDKSLQPCCNPPYCVCNYKRQKL